MNKNGQVKKVRRQRAVIIITENEDPEKFNATLSFEPSIKDKRTGQISATAQDHIVCRTAWHVWNNLKEQQRTHIILTDE